MLVTLLRGVDVNCSGKTPIFSPVQVVVKRCANEKKKTNKNRGTPYNGLYGQAGGVPSYEMVGKSVISLSQRNGRDGF